MASSKHTTDEATRDTPKLSECFQNGAVDWPKLMVYLDHHAEAFPLISSASRIVKLSPGVSLIIAAVTLVILFAFGRGTSMICDAAGLLYPGYKTYKVIKHFNENPEIRREATQEMTGAIGVDSSTPQEQLMFWAKYWVVYSLAFVFKYVFLAVFFWFPFFDIFRLFLAVALFHPKLRVGRRTWCTSTSQGAEVVFDFVVFPFLIQYEKRIDGILDFTEKKMSSVMEHYKQRVLNSGPKGHASR
ncbi:HVA22/TB2/DP1 family protein, putative [Babesia caballi]|uniref:HVA22/TB2/DP1 family protein, putative n=1 Tax=Babesia caballi TaxID=5871 RepID=A0AAV4LUQ0_BABCB|nr:HVA22/TB2/DP1 family protein, putative [Babesia caballi]